MTVSRAFLVTGAVYLAAGIGLGLWMGIAQDHSMKTLHAHVNLVGFTLMTVFGLCYHLLPGLGGRLAQAHFALHQLGAAAMVVGLFLLYGLEAGPAMAEPFLIAGSLVLGAAVLLWLANILRAA